MQPVAPSTLCLLLLAAALACGPAPAVVTPTPAPAREGLAGPPTPEAPAPGDERFTGRVLERLPAGPYTYLQVATESGARWVVTMGAAPEGAVEVRNMGTRKHFHARRLGREFDELVFGIVESVGPRSSESI